MSAISVIVRRESFQLLRSAHGLLPLFFALGAYGAIFSMLLQRSEGTAQPVAALWGLATALCLPFLAAVAASRGFTQDRERGMMRLMFATPVRARTWVLGKIIAAWILCAIYTLGTYLLSVALMRWVLPNGATLPSSFLAWIFPAALLALQSFLWASAGTLVSLLTKSSSATVFLCLLVCTLVPAGLYFLFGLWMPTLHVQWPFIPLQAQVYDAALGILDGRTLLGTFLVSTAIIYAAGLIYDSMRMLATER